MVKLRYFKEYSYEEISVELEIPIGTVKAQLFRSREQLFKILSGKRCLLMDNIIFTHFPDLTDIQKKQFSALSELYEFWNTQINVVSRKDMCDFLERRFTFFRDSQNNELRRWY